jgi:PAS domain S-box-containing protein
VAREPETAAWLIASRQQIEQLMAERLGPARPEAGAPETEALRRFRSYACSALQRGVAAAPALDGLHASERRIMALLECWSQAAAELAAERADAVRALLAPLVADFRNALRSTGAARRARGAPRGSRRAVMAAIDRVCDAFLAIDADSGRLVDANPAAGALLGVARDALLGVEASAFIEPAARQEWATALEAVTEGAEPRRFPLLLRDRSGAAIAVDCTATRFSTREHTLALILARPRS